MTRSGFAAPGGFRDSRERALAAGEVVASTYAVRDEIARTEIGVVYDARDMLLDRAVALKIAWRDPGTPSLLPEVRRCAAVRDPCAAQIYGMGSHKGVEYAVGERVTGKLLHDAIDTAAPPELYLERFRTIVAAVSRAHDAHIAVGDISGATVLVCPDGRLVLGRLSLSQVPAFGHHGRILAPEVVRGEVDSSDPAAAEAIDLYGLGCVAIELACGAPPFADDDPHAELRGHAYEPPPRVASLRADLPGDLSELVDWLLAKQPAKRPRSAKDVLAQLGAVIDRLAGGARSLRVLIVEDDASRARWMQSLARRAHAAAIVEVASEGTDAAHKLNRDQPDLVFVTAKLKGLMNALELCMYLRGLDYIEHGHLFVIGELSLRDRDLLGDLARFLPDDASLAGAILDLVREAVAERRRARQRSTLVSG